MPKILLFDSYDSFTYNLKHYLEEGGADVDVIRNDTHSLKEIMALNPDGLVLSPGPKHPIQSGNLMEVLKYFENKIPILGVCLGHQAIGLLHDYEVVKSPVPKHGKVSEIHIEEDEIFEGIPNNFNVCRYHSLTLERKKDSENRDLREIGWSEDGLIMAIRIIDKPVWGVQYHPEAILTEHGHRLIYNWLKVVTLRRH